MSEIEDEARARKIVNEADCATWGHTFDVLQVMAGYPVGVTCTRCGKSWPVGDDEEQANAKVPELNSGVVVSFRVPGTERVVEMLVMSVERQADGATRMSLRDQESWERERRAW